MDTLSQAVIEKPFGVTKSGEKVSIFKITNKNGLSLEVINLGGIITSLCVPDKYGKLGDVVLGYDTLKEYEDDSYFMGAIIGRYCNRIANGRLEIDGNIYQLEKNNGEHHLHGGDHGFHKRFWDIIPVKVESGVALKLSRVSKDMECGYPGNLTLEVLYILDDNNELIVKYRATTDKKTVVNLTQHSYFNLSAGKSDTITNHKLHLNADYYLPVHDGGIPIGELAPVADTPFDFTEATEIKDRLGVENDQLKLGYGFDHCWAIKQDGQGIAKVATLYDPVSGRLMEAYTSEPGVQFYSGNFLNNGIVGKGDALYGQRQGLCLETGHFPNSPNQDTFPSTILLPGEVYESTTTFRFTTQ